jgi:transcription elongation GreA/GreB family factor
MKETKIDKLRTELIKLRKEREKIIFEKGMAANENKDLRENSAYDYWFEKEMQISSRINHIISMIEKSSPKKKVEKARSHKIKREENIELDRPKWL